jgi:hypothetical protein
MSDLVKDLIEAASEVTGVSPAEILGRGREYAPAATRHAVWLVLREHGWELRRIGAAWARDHSTISHGTLQAERRARVDPDARFLLEEVRRVARRGTLPDGIENRVQVSMYAMDQEIAVAEALVEELASKLATLRALRAQAAAIMRDMAGPDTARRHVA